MEKYTEQLTAVYKKAAEDLISTIRDKQARGNVTQYQRSVLAQVYETLGGLSEEAKRWANEAIPEIYKQAIEDTNKMFVGMGIPITASFSRLHTEAVNLIVTNTIDDLITAHNYIGRQYIDTLRQIGLESTALKVSQGQTVKEMKKRILNSFVEKGISAILYKNGRIVRVENYAELVARSTSREAYNRATMNQVTTNGYDLVKMSSHPTTCNICAALQGRVYSISGTSPDYPPLNKAFSGKYANIHPHCKHSLAPYVPALADNPAKDLAFSNRSFDIDPRTAEERKRYDDKQQKLRDRNTDRREYEKYKNLNTDGTPKSFSGFRKMKASNNENYKNLQSNYDDLNK